MFPARLTEPVRLTRILARLTDDVVHDGLVAVRAVLGHPEHPGQDAAHVAILLANVGGQQPQAVVRPVRERCWASAADLLTVVGVQGRQAEPYGIAELGVIAEQDFAREVQRAIAVALVIDSVVANVGADADVGLGGRQQPAPSGHQRTRTRLQSRGDGTGRHYRSDRGSEGAFLPGRPMAPGELLAHG